MSPTATGMGMVWASMEPLASPRPRRWLPTHTIPQRIAIRYLCGATMAMAAQEALVDAKTRLEYPIWATVYSREQKWTIR